MSAVVMLALMLPLLGLARPARPSAAGEPVPVGGAAVPAALAAPVTKVVGDAAGALGLVRRTHTAVFAEDQPHTAAAAGLLALRLRVPMILVPPSDHPSEPAASEAARADLAAAVRQRGVTRAIAVGDGVADVARRSGAREVVRTDAVATADAAGIIALATGTAEAPSNVPHQRGEHGRGDLAALRVPAPRATGA
ncbi:MAG TPA: hypothetical protein VK891_07760, partial [Euzebyales bacterium]|nr:hypothetical protein [Euzebyales bacterium]